jgi:2-polyprenyl-3-methyl-5-hydroxy-6-metoxy-1,4-benzoquinol methylase
MKYLDHLLQRWRIAKARPFITPGARVLDIGSADGALFQQLGSRIQGGLGIDPTLQQNKQLGNFTLMGGFFPKDMPPVKPFDAITMLAVLEHFPATAYPALKGGCAKFLKPGGTLIITVPSPLVDHILKVLLALRLIHGMSLEEHHGYEVSQTAQIFSPPDFQLVRQKRFQLGLNNLFVFQRRTGV